MGIKSLTWMGIRTPHYAKTVAFYRDVIGLSVYRDGATATWFRLDKESELHVYRSDDEDHSFFGEGPVVGFEVDDFNEMRERMTAAGITVIGDPQHVGTASWNHFIGPDDNVYEIMERG